MFLLDILVGSWLALVIIGLSLVSALDMKIEPRFPRTNFFCKGQCIHIGKTIQVCAEINPETIKGMNMKFLGQVDYSLKLCSSYTGSCLTPVVPFLGDRYCMKSVCFYCLIFCEHIYMYICITKSGREIKVTSYEIKKQGLTH